MALEVIDKAQAVDEVPHQHGELLAVVLHAAALHQAEPGKVIGCKAVTLGQRQDSLAHGRQVCRRHKPFADGALECSIQDRVRSTLFP